MKSTRILKQNVSSNDINTTQSTSLLFREIYHRVKLKAKMSLFISNLKRNNIYSKPAEYEMQNEYHMIDWKGWKANPTLQIIILILDITLTMANFFYASFEAFLPEFQQFKERNSNIFLINLFAVLIYFINIVLSLTTQEVQKGVHFIYLTDIIKKELTKGWFYVQLGLMIVMIVNMSISSQKASEIIGIIFFILCILKQYFLQQSLFKIQIMFVNTPNKERYWNLIKVAVLNVMFAHFFASIFLAMLKMRSERHWFQTKSGVSVDADWFQKYLWSFYWACTTMTTIGYGDFTPAIVEEAVIVSFIQIISAIVIAYNISQIGNIILSIHQGNRAINSKIGLLRRMNRQNTVSTELNVEIEQYLVNQKAIQESFEYVKHRQLISSLPFQLQKKYYGQSQKNIFRHLPFFMNLSSDTLIKFFLQSTGKVYYPGEFIIHKSLDQEIVIALKGELGYCYRKRGSHLNETIVETVAVDYSKDRPILLARNVLNRTEGIHYDVKATRYSYTMMIDMQTFTDVLGQSELDYHYFLMSRDMHQGDSSLATNECLLCKLNHTRFQCPKLHFIPLKAIVIAKYAADNKKKQRRLTQTILYRKVWENRHAYLFSKMIKDQSGKSDKNIPSQFELGRKLISLRSIGTQRIIADHIEIVSGQNFDDFDELADFQHYFISSNPQKLINAPLRKKPVNFNQRI